MVKVISRDGTPIAYYSNGSGPSLILVHGTTINPAIAWAAFYPKLVERYRVITIDRRGQGESGDSRDYAIEREFEDIAAVIDAVGGHVDVLAHSFGGLLALEAALLTYRIRKLVMYEGVPIPGAPMYPQGLIEQLEALANAGDMEGVLKEFYCGPVGMSPAEYDRVKASPSWPVRLAAAHTIPRELRAFEQYQFDPNRFKDLKTPTYLLVGGDSPQFVKDATETVHRALPNCHTVVLPGQQHIPQYTAPDLLLGELNRILLDA